MVEAELALVRASTAVGITPAEAAEVIEIVLAGYRPDPAELARRAVASGNPVIPLVAELRALVDVGDLTASRWVHRGATSQDIVDTALMLVASRAVAAIDTSLSEVERTLAALADTHRGTLMAARTLTQQSTPTTFGLVAAGWALAVRDARSGLPATGTGTGVGRGAALPAQLGGASGTLAAFREIGGSAAARELPARFAAELGLQAPLAPWHTRRAPVTRLGDALASVVDALSQIATSVATLARSEIAELAEGVGGGSSTMPQKQNPVQSILIRSAGQRAPALAAELHRSAALATDQRPDGPWHAEWPALRELLRLALGTAATAAELVAGLRVDTGRMRATLDAGGALLLAERVALALSPVLGAAVVTRLLDRATAGEDLAALLLATGAVDEATVADLLDPARYLGESDSIIDAALLALGHRS
ncbi:hypothetical protein G3T37_13050 [Galbitalea soli]|uniref:Adenylosuccinate lyase C-terminal domain-containing protein n=2 Tax=Galbitalea soli TaxID=1268042 RepID=A0A7C9TRS6_9MICO|nr:hypothetical protein [Galbitalea soli]